MMKTIKTLTLVFILSSIAGCGGSSKLSAPSCIDGNKIIVNGSTRLTKDYTNTMFIVTEDSTLDLAGYTVSGITCDGSKGSYGISLHNRASVTGGTVTEFQYGVMMWDGISDDERFVLKSNEVGLEEGRRLTQDFIAKAWSHQEVRGVTLDGNGIGLYTRRFVHHTMLTDNTVINSDVSSVYLDADSNHNTISDNTFKSCSNDGDHRGCVQIDASSNNLVSNNTIADASKGIELFKNCGEDNYARWNGSNYNELIGNKFQNVKYPINLYARTGLEPAQSCRQDDLGDETIGTIIKDNVYDNYAQKVYTGYIALSLLD